MRKNWQGQLDKCISKRETQSMKPTTSKAKEAERPVEPFYLEELQFDLSNPRYGTTAAKIHTEQEALNYIVDTFGVDDVLSSISVNGFFDSEPLVGLRLEKDKRIKIIEGNRRLAACLILAGDARAADQSDCGRSFRSCTKSMEASGSRQFR